jgi:hypothetical protein
MAASVKSQEWAGPCPQDPRQAPQPAEALGQGHLAVILAKARKAVHSAATVQGALRKATQAMGTIQF